VVIPRPGSLRQTSISPRPLSAEDTPVCTSKRAPHLSGLPFECVGPLLSAPEGAVLVFELVHGDGGQGGCGVVLRFVVVDFVNGDCGVDD